MKKRIISFALIGALFCGIFGTGFWGTSDSLKAKSKSQKNSLKVLALGNSFAADSLRGLYDIAKAEGIEDVTVCNLYIGGCSLQKHLKNAKKDKAAYTCYYNSTGEWQEKEDYRISDALKLEEWDYIMFLQYSGTSGQPESYEPLNELMDYVAENTSGNPAFVWDMTWAYQSDYEHKAFEKYGNDQNRMYKSIVKAVKQKIVPNGRIKYIIPVGTAIQNARTSYLGDNLTRDGRHLDLKYGRYTAALTVFGVLTGTMPDEVSFVPEGVSKKQEKVAKEAAKDALKKPFKVTKSNIGR